MLHHEIHRENQVVVVDLVAVILEIKLQMTSALLTTAGTHNREDERKEDAQTNPYCQIELNKNKGINVGRGFLLGFKL